MATTVEITIKHLNAMKTIVALVDFSDVTPMVADRALELAQKCGGDVLLVHVLPPAPIVVDYAPAISSDAEEEEARFAQLQALQNSMIKRHCVVCTQLLKGPVAETLLTHLQTMVPDLIVMGSHGHGALYNLVIGSVTQGIIKQAAWPVMVVPKVRAKEPVAETTTVSAKSEGANSSPLIPALDGALLPP